jgi:hypothetical protein
MLSRLRVLACGVLKHRITSGIEITSLTSGVWCLVFGVWWCFYLYGLYLTSFEDEDEVLLLEGVALGAGFLVVASFLVVVAACLMGAGGVLSGALGAGAGTGAGAVAGAASGVGASVGASAVAFCASSSFLASRRRALSMTTHLLA